MLQAYVFASKKENRNIPLRMLHPLSKKLHELAWQIEKDMVASTRGPIEMHDAVSADGRKQTQVAFKPDG